MPSSACLFPPWFSPARLSKWRGGMQSAPEAGHPLSPASHPASLAALVQVHQAHLDRQGYLLSLGGLPAAPQHVLQHSRQHFLKGFSVPDVRGPLRGAFSRRSCRLLLFWRASDPTLHHAKGHQQEWQDQHESSTSCKLHKQQRLLQFHAVKPSPDCFHGKASAASTTLAVLGRALGASCSTEKHSHGSRQYADSLCKAGALQNSPPTSSLTVPTSKRGGWHTAFRPLPKRPALDPETQHPTH